MKEKLWKTSVLIVAALFVGSCQAFNDWHGYVYEETLKLEDLKEIIAGNRPDELKVFRESEVARFLAQAEGKESSLFNGASPAELLALGLDPHLDSEKRFCQANVFRKFMTTCEKVSGNEFLSGYCTFNLERLRTICVSNEDWLYKRIVIDPLVHERHEYRQLMEILNNMLHRLTNYALDLQRTPLSPEMIVKKQEATSFGNDVKNACKKFLMQLNDLLIIDSDENIYKYLKKERRYADLNLRRYCAAILKL